MKIEKQNTENIYKMISAMNIAFGNKKGIAIDNGKITDFGFKRLKSQLENLYDENRELRDDAFIPNVRHEIFDAVADLSVFLYGANHFVNKSLPDLIISFEDGIIEFDGKTFSDKDTARKYISENSFQALNKEIDLIIKSVEDRDLDSYERYAYNLAVSLFVIFEVFKKEDKKYTMIYLNKLVNESNLSKLCRNTEEVEKTLHFYRVKDVEVDFKESDLLQEDGKPFLIVYSTKDQFVHDRNEKGEFIYKENGEPEIKEYRENKFLKNTNWFEPDLSDF